jgi:hypothetical protein
MLPLLLLLLTACAAASDKNWPSLARRPAEAIATGLTNAPAQVPPTAETPPSPPSTIATARLLQVERDLGSLESRYAKQYAAAETAVKAARGAARNSDAWSGAQVEMSRLGKLGAQADAARERLDGIAGDLAEAAAGGANVASPLAEAGRLIQRAQALRSRHAEAARALALPN